MPFRTLDFKSHSALKIVWLSILGVTELAVFGTFASLDCGFCVATVGLVVSLGLVFVLSLGSVVSVSWKLASSISQSLSMLRQDHLEVQ